MRTHMLYVSVARVCWGAAVLRFLKDLAQKDGVFFYLQHNALGRIDYGMWLEAMDHGQTSAEPTTSPLTDRAMMISNLDIRNPDFYSVFNDSELHRYFTPLPPRIPIYVWTRPAPFSQAIRACALPKEQRGQHENEWNLYESLLTSRHREYVKHKALLHYVPFYMHNCSDPYRTQMDSIIMESSEYKQYRGANFIVMWNTYKFWKPIMYESQALFENGTQPTSAKPLASHICFDNHSSPDMCHCHVPEPGGPQSPPVLSDQELDITERLWPPYDTTKYQNLSHYYLQTRRFNFIFVGQMDLRKEYRDRVKCARSCDQLAKPSVYIQTTGTLTNISRKAKSPSLPEYPDCSSQTLNVSSRETITCFVPPHAGPIDFDKLLARSRYGWHHRGDLPNSARLTDLFNTLTLPVITSPLLSDTSNPFQCTIPYDALSFYVPPKRFWKCRQVVREITNIPKRQLEQKLRLLYYYRPYYVNSDVSWEALLRDTVSGCLSSSMLTDFNMSMSDFVCKYNNKYKSQRMPQTSEADENPLFVI